MKTIPHCIECKQPISRGVHEFSRQLYGYSLCMKDQYIIGESGATAHAVDVYLALKSKNFPVILGFFDGYKQVDIALPGKLYIEFIEQEQFSNWQTITSQLQSVYALEKKIPTIIISGTVLNNADSFSHIVDELSKACRLMLIPSQHFRVSCAPPFTAVQLQ